MEIRKARIIETEKSVYLELELAENTTNIPLTEENQNKIMESFNKILLDLKNGLFSYQLEKTEENLFFQVSSEYIKLLNKEIKSIYSQMLSHDLVKEND